MTKSDFFINFANSILASFFGALWVFAFIIGAVITIGLLYLIVRYLLVTTRAAQVYIDLNAPAKPAPTAAKATTAKAPVARTAPKATPKSTTPKA